MKALLTEQELVQSVRETVAGAIFQLQGPLNLISAAENMLERRSSGSLDEPLMNVLQQALSSGEEAMETLRASMPEKIEEAKVAVDINQILREALSLSTDRNCLYILIQVDFLSVRSEYMNSLWSQSHFLATDK